MRSVLLSPPPTFTTYLRSNGYKVFWPGKTDFNFTVRAGSFDSTNQWKNQFPQEPFFAYINLFETHESQIRAPAQRLNNLRKKLKPGEFHDPAKMVVPPYHPDAPEVRRDLANYYDLVTVVDYGVGEILDRIKQAGIEEHTVVFFFGDHGRGLPRSKRWIYDSGIHVPLLVKWPGQIRKGSVRQDLVSFIDFAPTVLSIANVPIPADFQGQAFLGPRRASPRKYIYAARDRMDETPDRIRCVRDTRYKYVRNFHPELPYAQKIAYMEEMPTMQVWRQWNEAGKLTGPQKLFFAPTKPVEELYDLEKDPCEINNLAAVPKYSRKLRELSRALDRWISDTKDLGAIPETELIKQGLVKDLLVNYQERNQPGYRPK